MTLESVTAFLSSWKFVLAFYILVGILIYIYRKKFDVESGFVLLYRTDFGIKFIDRLAEKNKEFWKIVGYSAIGIGFAGMIVMCGFLLKGLYDLVFVPGAPPTVSLVLPGVQVPGSPIFVPFWYGIIALFTVIVFHEFGHGVIARAHGLKIKNTGFGFFGPLPLAFVEPDEKQVVKKDSIVQQSIFAAGPFFNALLVGVVLVVMLIVNPLMMMMVNDNGVSFSSVQKDFPAEMSGLKQGTGYTSVNGIPISDANAFISSMSCLAPNETVVLGNSQENVTIVATSNPKDSAKGYIGVSGISTNYELKRQDSWFKGIYYLLFVFNKLLEWIATLSLGIGLANLLPLGPVDGGRMLHKAAIDVKGKQKGIKLWATITMIVIVAMIILVFVPIIKHVFFKG